VSCHDWKKLDPPIAMNWISWAGIGPKPIPVKRTTFFDHKCLRCGLWVQEGGSPERLADSLQDCDMVLVRSVMES
jgi:hypothetical protein